LGALQVIEPIDLGSSSPILDDCRSWLIHAFATGQALATVVSLADTSLWRRPRVEQEKLVVVAATRGRPGGGGAVSSPDYVAFRDRATTVSALAAHYSTAPLFVALDDNAREVNGAVVSDTCRASAR